MSKLGTTIATVPWITCLTAEQQRRVEAELIVREVAKGNYLCRRGEAVDQWYGIVEGLVKFRSTLPTGKTAAFIGLLPGSWFGDESLLKDQTQRYDVVALRNSQIACVPRSTFHWLLDNNNRFAHFVLTLLSERLSQFVEMLEDRQLGAKARVRGCLASFFNPILRADTGTTIKLSQEEIGSIVGLSRQRVNTCLKALEDSGLLRTSYGEISIIDLERLRHIRD